MNLLLEQLHLHVGAMEGLAALAENERATLVGGSVVGAAAAYQKILNALERVEEVLFWVAAQRIESMPSGPVAYEFVEESAGLESGFDDPAGEVRSHLLAAVDEFATERRAS
jgi:hypothetical protein